MEEDIRRYIELLFGDGFPKHRMKGNIIFFAAFPRHSSQTHISYSGGVAIGVNDNNITHSYDLNAIMFLLFMCYILLQIYTVIAFNNGLNRS